ncbi:MAG: hypothetical protein A2621_01325 [Alphaproteobacteria bacterium RIFCSPHIGHO2_01_FULL_41_14]|nr:MAG: hypothetical protein A2065_02520 [Alphaproteobacteria bacterium GWB1_45_5]OFW76439.1 MAG: hypothetical protein A3K20_04870 [Alphaproteobacteria bacterium GWA1_45_9]OFW89544.1 MAG: hypothetical protein A2621_01325 [Alphaproteobacteria bacterium RIFCSPHIGHO2_01_FULL_41_14]HCI48885.1 hypothetical protein [Holosporales bacterium]
MDIFLFLVSLFLNLPSESLLLVEFFLCGILILLAERFFGLAGLYVYTAMGVVAANISVLKTVQFAFYPVPMALGTIVFGSLFLCSDMINERYGKAAALKAMGLGFFGYFTTLLMMVMTLGYAQSSSFYFQSAVSFLMIPGPSLFLASLIAYFLGQYVDIFLYHFIHVKTGQRYLWVRSLVSTLLAIFIDNTLFSLLAWHFFAVKSLAFEDIFWTYILGGTILRMALSLGNVAFMYISSFLNRNKNPHVPSVS